MSDNGKRVTPLRDRAYSKFTDRLLSRDLAPGQIVSQRELVELTGLPLSAVREMVPRLEADGLVTTVPKRGMIIAHVDVNLVRNAFQLRQALEREAVVEFCRTASDEVIDAILAEHEELLEAAAKEVTPELVERAQHVDWGFHDKLIDALGNGLISDIYRVNSIKIRLIAQASTLIFPNIIHLVLTEHLQVIRALKARNADDAAAALRNHINVAKRRALQD